MMETNNIHKNNALRKALSNREMKLPEMPADLNRKVMQRMSAKPQRKRVLWPWIAAACVVGVISIFLVPPKSVNGNLSDTQQTAKENVAPENDSVKVIHVSEIAKETSYMAESKVRKAKDETRVKTENDEIQPEMIQSSVNIQNTEKAIDVKAVPKDDNRSEIEKRLNIIHPERLEYTPEEIQKLKKRAREKYQEWIQLEQEIMKATETKVASLEQLETDTINSNINKN